MRTAGRHTRRAAAVACPPPMIFLDVNTFFAERAGGIRTYHRAKIAWFAAQAQHTYYLVHPGPRHAVTQAAPNVFLVQVYGAPTGRAEGGYRWMLDYPRILRLVEQVRPDVVEVGDPWLSGAFARWMRRSGRFTGLLSAFYHSDAVRTWVEPWARRPGALAPLRRGAAARVGDWFYRRQDAYDVTVVTSRAMERHLRGRGVRSVARLPFGTDPAFFAAGADAIRGRSGDGTVRLLYAGRLGREKGAELLLAALPRLLDDPRVHVTVMGRGANETGFAAIRHPRFDFRGFVGDRAEVARTFAAHDVLLAPGPHETFGLSVLEGMAAGMAVVGPDAGGTGELLEEVDSPFVFAAGDADGFRDAVMRAVGSDPAAGAAKARALARRYGTWDDAIARMVAFYEDRVARTDAAA
ncbi:MAG: glycosyltransferase family 1 protein [Gemmatimonadetes bacterium]|nr:glycosyltransferase family 1 protein [Gemmatimonadota bacterium]